MLSPIDTFETGGLGGVFDGTDDGFDPLISEDTIVAIDNRFLLVANPGSDSISSFSINSNYSLSLIGSVPTGGVGPDSIAYHDGIVYVTNVDSDGTPAQPPAQRGNVTGLRFDTNSGQLIAIAGSTRQLTNWPSDVEFSPDGKFLIVSSWNAGSTMLSGSDGYDSLVVYGVKSDGSLTTNPTGMAAPLSPAMPPAETYPR